MKRSSMVSLFLLSLAALSCDDPAAVKDCVDERGIVVPERFCQGKLPDAGAMTDEERHYYQTVIVPRGPTYVPVYQWHYDTVYVPVGNRIWGGSYVPSSGVTYVPSSSFRGSAPGRVSMPSSFSVSRGGFGATGHSFFSGGGS